MRPEDQKSLNIPARSSVNTPPRHHDAAHTAVADLTRQQIDQIYNQQSTGQAVAQQTPPAAVSSTPPQTEQPNTYHRTHQPAHTTRAVDWQKYHSAWQDYYQQYYEKYYTGAVAEVHRAYTDQATRLHEQVADQSASTATTPADESISTDEAMYDLRSQIVTKVHESGKKVRKSRHFMPAVAAISVLILFTLLQFNRVIIANVKAYVTPGEIDPQNIIVDPTASTVVGPKPLLVIPKINVSVPIVFNTQPDYNSQMKAMERGVAYFGIPGANSKPGQVGNTVISGHSSNDFIDAGDFKFVFALLERLKKGDVFYVNYKGTRYTYTVTKTRVVKPTNVNALIYPTDKPEVTLITCTPLGTSLNRLLVTAEQVSPDPAKADAAPTSGGAETAEIPGNSPTFIERVFGAN